MVREDSDERLALYHVVKECETLGDGVTFFLKGCPSKLRSLEFFGEKSKRLVELIWNRFVNLCWFALRHDTGPQSVACVCLDAKRQLWLAMSELDVVAEC